jgi:hypothetical protein
MRASSIRAKKNSNNNNILGVYFNIFGIILSKKIRIMQYAWRKGKLLYEPVRSTTKSLFPPEAVKKRKHAPLDSSLQNDVVRE